MANRPINQLDNASSLDPTDLLVLWDSGTDTAQNMTGQQFTTWLTALAAGKGGISSISKTGTAGLVDTYTITYADTSTSTFTVTNGAKGDQGDQTHVWIMYSATEPESDADMSVIPAPWIGIYCGLEATQSNLHYTDYTWYEIKGPKGDGVSYTAQTGTAGLTKTYTMYTADGTAVGTFSVTNGEGGVSTVNNIAPDGNGNVPAIVTDVTVLGLTSGSATIADAYDALQVSQILFAPAADFAVGELPLVGGSRLTSGTVEIIKATSDGSRGRINFYGKGTGDGDFRMFLGSGNTPTGTWLGMMSGNLSHIRSVVLSPNTSYDVGFPPALAIIDWYNSNGTFKSQIIPVSGTTMFGSDLQQIGTFSWAGTSVSQNSAYYVTAIVFG